MILTVTLNPCLHKLVRFRGELEGRVVVRPVETEFQAGGKGVNAARIVHRLGGDATALTFVGGAVGTLFAATLEAEGVHLAGVPMAKPTRMSTLVLGVDSGQFREFLEPGVEVDASELAAFEARYVELLEECELVALSGSTPCTALDGFFARAVTLARERGRRVLVDTYGPAAPLAAAALPDLLKANREEVVESFAVAPDDAAIDAFARAAVESGIGQVLITDGPHPARLWSRHGRHEAIPPRVVEVNPVGSGDAMIGALALELARGRSPLDGLRLASAAGAANAERAGVCDPTRARIEELAREVVIRPCPTP
jgi:1-phosphofructokinase family hexose kinase